MHLFTTIKAKKQWEMASVSRENLILQNIQQQGSINELMEALTILCNQFETPSSDIYPNQVLVAWKSIERGNEALAKVKKLSKAL